MSPNQLIHFAFASLCLQVIILFSTIPANATLERDKADISALREFKRGITSDPFGAMSSWNDTTTFCSWQGVACGSLHRRVVGLDLNSLRLRGSVSPHIGNLSFLRLLDLSNNSFSSPIPQEIGRLFRLRHLYLPNNSVSGEIPTRLSNCSQLVVIDFGWNKLVGGVPSELGSLTKLQELQLMANNLTGLIPFSVGNLSSLVYFSVPYNNFEGRIPEDISRLRSLSFLVVGANKFSGELPSSLYNMSSLTIISTARNRINGTIPANVGHTLPNLEELAISSNDFSGPIPLSLSNASKLQTVILSTNSFAGAVPRDLGKLVNLWWLGFGSNFLGSNSTDDLDFIASLSNISRLKTLDFSNNLFGGVLPNSIANLSSTLSNLYLGENQISGAIPKTLEKYRNLLVLDMADNHFSGIIPPDFGRFGNIQGMDLSRNRLAGSIPSSFGNLTHLALLFLYENKLNGSIPPSIGNCQSLQFLDMAENNLVGAIPKDIADLSSLSLSLNLSHNSFSGTLPVELGNLKITNTLDFSANNLSGIIPLTIGDCESLESLSLQDNSFEGVIPSSLASLKGLSYIDISHNKLSGNIPKGLQNLSFLVYFNASFNDLEGAMPIEGVFRNASAISVMGNNKLCGGVPELQFPACVTTEERKRGMSRTIKLSIIITCTVLCLVIFSFFLALYLKSKTKKGTTGLSMEDSVPNILPKVSYKMLYDGTEGFSFRNLIGSGSFGSVYKAVLNSEEKVVAVKVLKVEKKGALKSFVAECTALRNIRHRNLVKIITSCSSIDYHGNEFKALVFEFIENSSLEEWLHPQTDGGNQSRNLNFVQRLNVAIDIASALQYLHCECEPPIVHCDLKPSNVLLDNDMVAHVGDFGLARILSITNGIPDSQTSTIGLRGSFGYADPEYAMGGKASIQGDVYSYRILLLEMFTRKRPTDEMFEDGLNIHDYTKKGLPERVMQIADRRLFKAIVEARTGKHGNDTTDQEINVEAETYVEENIGEMNEKMHSCLTSVLQIGLACSMESPNERMNTSTVVRELFRVKSTLLGAASCALIGNA